MTGELGSSRKTSGHIKIFPSLIILMFMQIIQLKSCIVEIKTI